MRLYCQFVKIMSGNQYVYGIVTPRRDLCSIRKTDLTRRNVYGRNMQ